MTALSQNLLSRSHSISIEDAQTLITNFASEKSNIITGDYSESEPLLTAQSFNKEALLRLLEQEDCIGIRFYNGFNSSNKIVLVATGIDSDGNDLNLAPNTTPTDVPLLQAAQPCPDWCPAASLINS